MHSWALCFLPLSALLLAAPKRACAQAESLSVHMAYSAYAAGLNVINLEADFATGPRGYRADIAFRTAGTFRVFVSSENLSTVQGVWRGARAQPTQFRSHGVIRGTPHEALIEYDGGAPSIRRIEPPVEEEREPVPAAMQRDTIDTLSAMAMLLRMVTETGRCDGGATTFDGRRLSEIAVHTAGTVKLPPESRSTFSGETLQCDFEGRQTGGYERGIDREQLQKPQKGSAWVARVVPGGPLIPVRMSFHTRFFGQATMYLTAAGPGMATFAAAK